MNNKVFEFRRHFDITEEFKGNHVFKLDPMGNLITVWNNKDYYLTNRRNPTKFLSIATMQHKLKFGVDFLCDLKIIAPKVSKIKLKPKPQVPTLEEQLEAFKKSHNIPEDANLPTDLKLVDDKPSINRRGKCVPLYSGNKPLANSTLQTKYGAKFLKDLNSIPTVKHQKPELVQLPFNQFKYDKDFENSLNEFFLDESSLNDPSKLSLEELKTPIGNYLKSYQMIIPSGIKDPILLFEEVKSTFKKKTLESNLDSLESLKYSIGFELVFKKDSYNGPDTFTDPPVRLYTKNEAVFNQDEINLDKQFLELGERIENFIQDDSGWKLGSLKTLWLDIAQYKPLKGSSYIPLPDVLKHKKAIINVKNDDDNCLRYALRSALFPANKNSDNFLH